MITKLKLSDAQLLEIIQNLNAAQREKVAKELAVLEFMEKTQHLNSDLSLEEIQQLVDEVRQENDDAGKVE